MERVEGGGIILEKIVEDKMLKRFLILILVVALFSYASGKKPEDVLIRIYPGSTVEVKNFTLSPQQVEKIRQLSKIKFDSRLVSLYIVKKDGKILAYGYVDVHTVRTKPEIVLYTITPDGKLDVVEVLYFGEPLEYLPEENWFKNFKGKSLDKDSIKTRSDIPNVSGATLTSKAVTDYARLALAIWKVLVGDEK
ncbi:FMN-binding domain protein [Sulfurihydrogenibium azorense Az-Fu1]|uniref:FMN-binding domain protein n=1 Tax=Sulfurihydrogenibium azorense (strain DSM 15241 / OCM 825 / Az-Fu1) TaxID=204536 RepID=C1DUV9_SULAA|nr:FMN-binding protein [Sulfurihydrogenibium azorense]ACN98364.1 FMN-binding domain protein [Sulfurihydrogenibium azorense Az-Fu1]